MKVKIKERIDNNNAIVEIKGKKYKLEMVQARYPVTDIKTGMLKHKNILVYKYSKISNEKESK